MLNKAIRTAICLGVLIFCCAIFWRYKSAIHVRIDNFMTERKQKRLYEWMHKDLDKISELSSLQDDSTHFYTKYRLIAHAGGTIEGRCYTNSKEAFEYSYQKGNRIFDADLAFTSDSILVLRHSWKDYLETEEVLLSSVCKSIDANGQPQLTKNMEYVPTYDEFNSNLIHKLYTPMNCEDLILFMQEHQDVYVAPDMKMQLPDVGYKYLIDLCKEIGAMDVLSRIIVTVYTFDHYNKVSQIYPFSNKNIRQFAGSHAHNYYELTRFCIENNIHAVSLSACFADDEGVQMLISRGINVYIAVCDYWTDFIVYEKLGFRGAVSNSLYESNYLKVVEDVE